MIICVCTEYKTSDMKKDIENDLSLKDIIKKCDLKERCKKCCCYFKSEYDELRLTTA